jgi:hypothetical protein
VSASLLIIVASSALFAYWFRYICLLILEQRTSTEYAAKVAIQANLSFLQVQQELATGTANLSALESAIQHDYRVLSLLLQKSGGADSVERKLLAVDYKLMSLWFRMTRSSSSGQARKALAEMASIVSFYAVEVGQCARA